MAERKLSPEQIEDLFAFCEEQDVKYYDVQIELVDHLASAIEQKWLEKPALSYDKALWSVFDQFGLSGFRKIRRAKEKELRGKYFRIQWKYFGEFFNLPKIIMTIAITLALFIGLRISNNDFNFIFIILAVYLISLFAFLFSYYSKKLRLDLIPGKYFLLSDYLESQKIKIVSAGIFLPFNVYLWLRITSRYYEFTQFSIPVTELMAAFSITLFYLLSVVMIYHVPQRIKEDFTREFPQFVKS